MIKPIGAMLLIEKPMAIEDKKTASGLVIAAAFIEQGPKSGKVVDMGEGEYNFEGKLMPIVEIKVGDIVYYNEHSAVDIEDDAGNKYLLVNHKNVLAKKNV